MKIISLFFHLPAVVWTTRWAIVKICSAIVRISSEPVEISSELVRISSELVSTILELLIISVFRKNAPIGSTPTHSALQWSERRTPFIFTFIYWIFPPSLLGVGNFRYDWHLLVMVITHTMQHTKQQRFASPQCRSPTPFCYLSVFLIIKSASFLT